MKAYRAFFLIGMAMFALLLVVGIVPTTAASVTAAAPQQQREPENATTAAARITRDSGQTANITYESATGVANFVTVAPGSLTLKGASFEAQAQSFLDSYGAAFGITDAKAQLALAKTQTDRIGGTHLSYDQVERGVSVYAGVMKVHFNAAGQLTAVNGEFVPNIKTSAKPKVSADEAAQIAIAEVAAQKASGATLAFADLKSSSVPYTAVANTLNFYHTGIVKGVAGPTLLTYQVEVTNGSNVREFVFVDAHSRRVVEQFSGIHEGAGADREISETSLGNVVWDESNGDPDPITAGWAGGTAQQVTDWQNEIDGSKETYNVIDNMVGYSSYDGAEATMRTVNNDPGISCPNANWNGISTNYCTDVTGDDTVAHEWGHAYTEYTHNLVYAWQPGALNESYSDIWGEIVDFLNGRGIDAPDLTRTSNTCSSNVAGANFPGNPTVDTVRWLSGEDDPAFNGIPGGSGNAIRDMWDPTCFGDPGKVSDTEYFCASTDSGGVHSNSGVPNHAFALLVDGGTYNSQTIAGIGVDKAAYIYWQAQFAYQSITSDFVDHASSLAASCQDLKGNATLTGLSTSSTPGAVIPAITQADCDELDKVIAAVEFNVEPTQCGFTPAWTAAPALCDGQGNGTVLSIEKQDWESGQGSWTVDTHDIANALSFDNPDWTIVGSLPNSRSGSAMYVEDSINRGACTVDDTVAGALNLDSPIIALPLTAEVPRVAIDHLVSTEVGWDGGNLKISVDGGPWTVVPDSAIEVNGYFAPGAINGGTNDNPLGGQEGWTGGGEGEVSTGWGQTQVNLLGIASAGQDIQLRFDMGLDGCNGVDGWYVDEVEVYSCDAEVNTNVCGDSVLDAGEQCDDGNASAGDGCSDTCQVESGYSCTDPIPGSVSGTNSVTNGGFEDGANGDWTIADSAGFGPPYPICDPVNCNGVDVAQNGSFYTWFGGIAQALTSSVEQSVNIPATATDLEFAMRNQVCDSAADNVVISVDGNTEMTIDGTSPICGLDTYSTMTVDVSAYADGGSHTLLFDYEQFATNGSQSNFWLDDVTIYDNVPTQPTPSVCTQIPNEPLACNSGIEGFEAGIPSDWTIIQGPGTGWGTTDDGQCGSGAAGFGNYAGTGVGACVDSDASAGLEDTYLCSPAIDLSTATSVDLDFLVNYQVFLTPGADDFFEVLVSTTSPSGPYDPAVFSVNDDYPIGAFAVPNSGSAESIDLSAYAGQGSAYVCFRYGGDFDWYAHVDDVALTCEIPSSLMCNAKPVDFESGIPGDWSVVDNEGSGVEWGVLADCGESGNFTNGAGDTACVSSDVFGPAEFDTELISSPFDIPAGDTATLAYTVNYQNFAGLDFLDVDISPDGGSSWTNVLSWNEDHGVLHAQPGEDVALDLSAYAGMNDLLLRWHYYDPNSGDYDWYAQVDDVTLDCQVPDIAVDPTTLHSAQGPDSSFDQTFEINNSGLADLNWTINEANDVNLAPDNISGPVERRGTGSRASDKVIDDIVNSPQADVVLDGGFEAGAFGGIWTEASTNFSTPICDAVGCGGTGGGTGPHSGTFWTWFGGIAGSEVGSVAQDVTMPATGSATLTFWLEQPACDSAADFMEVTMDGNQVFYTDGADADCGNIGYVQETVDVSAYADGGTHTLEFRSEVFGNNAGISNFFVDDVVLDVDGSTSSNVCDSPSDIPWATVSPDNGTTVPAGSDTVTVTFDSTGLAPGAYTGTLCIESNDPDEPLVEVLLELWVVNADFSDSPDSYGHAWHNDPWPSGIRNIWLGPGVNNDPGHIQNQDNGAGDDGVTRDMAFKWVSGATAVLNIEVRGSLANGWVAGWVDWDGNGVFDNPSERVLDQSVSNGTNSVNFPIPGSYVTGTTVEARFRVYGSAPVLGPTSIASPIDGVNDGEVEDYTWMFTPTAVELNDIGGQSSATQPGLMVITLLGVTLAAFGLFMRRRRFE